MTKIKHDIVPKEFTQFHAPIVKVKKILQSGAKIIQAEDIIAGLLMIHYSTFIMSEIYKVKSKDNTKILLIRSYIENITVSDGFVFDQPYISKLISYVDQLTKELNTTSLTQLFITIHKGTQTAEIYRKIHSDLSLYEFLGNIPYLHQDLSLKFKLFHDLAITLNK